jgi:hypothetical protein
MGRQTQFHVFPDDMKMFLEFVQGHHPVMATVKSCDSPKVVPVADPLTESQVMTLWNQTLLGSLDRKLVNRPGGDDYYRVDDSLPTLELSPSRLVEWNGQSGLLQGRVYGFFDRSLPEYEEWYESLSHWIRNNFKKSPLKLLGGYIGPEAFRWFQNGGILLPMFEPPPTSEWLSFVEKQHAVGSSQPT